MVADEERSRDSRGEGLKDNMTPKWLCVKTPTPPPDFSSGLFTVSATENDLPFTQTSPPRLLSQAPSPHGEADTCGFGSRDDAVAPGESGGY